MQSIAVFHLVKWLMQTEEKYFPILSLSLSSRAHPGGLGPPGWALEDREVSYRVVVVDRFYCICTSDTVWHHFLLFYELHLRLDE